MDTDIATKRRAANEQGAKVLRRLQRHENLQSAPNLVRPIVLYVDRQPMTTSILKRIGNCCLI